MTNFNLALHKLRRSVHLPTLILLKPMWMKHQIAKFRTVYFPAFRSEKNKKTFWRITKDLFKLYIKYKSIPFHYFHYGLYRQSVTDVDLYRYIPETNFYYRILPRINDHYVLLDDKIITDEILLNYHCPRPKLIMISRRGKWYDAERNRILDFQTFSRKLEKVKDLGAVVKPAVLSSGGEGITFLSWSAEQGWSDASGRCPLKNLFADPQRDLIVQERASNGGSLGHLGSNVLQCVRVLTSTLSGEPKCIYVTLKVSTSYTGVDNGHAGGAYLPVDMASGLVGTTAHDESGLIDKNRQHQGNILGGFILTEISQVISIASRAALAFPSLPIIGWDICISQTGPLIIEGNSSPGLALIQKPHNGAEDLIRELKTFGISV